MISLLLWNTKKGDILKNFFVHTMKVSGSKTTLDSHFMDNKKDRKKKGRTKVWNKMRVSKWWVSYPFKAEQFRTIMCCLKRPVIFQSCGTVGFYHNCQWCVNMGNFTSQRYFLPAIQQTIILNHGVSLIPNKDTVQILVPYIVVHMIITDFCIRA